MLLLNGEYAHSLDAKRRLSIPSKMRETIGGEIIVVPSLYDHCLQFFSQAEWEKYITPHLERVNGEEKDRLLRSIYTVMVRSTPDSLGRILLSEQLLRFIGVSAENEAERNLMVVGCGDYGEIWPEAAYRKNKGSDTVENFRDMLRKYGL